MKINGLGVEIEPKIGLSFVFKYIYKYLFLKWKPCKTNAEMCKNMKFFKYSFGRQIINPTLPPLPWAQPFIGHI